METKARRIGSGDLSQPGDYQFVTRYSSGELCGLAYMCPCGCGAEGLLQFRGLSVDDHPSWIWDGNRDAPTLTPSILRTRGCRWHGFLTAGVFRSC